MINRFRAQRRHRDCQGFTLVELLVVIVILGILSAVVVFAVRGSGDKGEKAASATDLRIVRTAMETFCASYGRYATDMDELAKGPRNTAGGREGPGFLSGESTYNAQIQTAPAGGNSCGGYTLSSGQDPPCERPAPPPGASQGPGNWIQTKSPGWGVQTEGSKSRNDPQMVQLTDGRIYTSFEIFDPKTDCWRQAGQLTEETGGGYPVQYDEKAPHTMVVLRDNTNDPTKSVCAPRCGQVLAHRADYGEQRLFGGFSRLGWTLFNPYGEPVPGQPPDRVGSMERVAGTGDSYNQLFRRAAQIMGTREECGDNCGKVLAVGGAVTDNRDAIGDEPLGSAWLYNPKTNVISVVDRNNGVTAQGWTSVVALPRGKVLVVTEDTGTFYGPTDRIVRARVFDPITSTFFDVAQPPKEVAGGRRPPVVLADGSVVFVYDEYNSSGSNTIVARTAIYRPGTEPLVAGAAVRPESGGSWIQASPCPIPSPTPNNSISNIRCKALSAFPGNKVLVDVFGDGSDSEVMYEYDPQADKPPERTGWTRAGKLISLGEDKEPNGGILLTGEGCGTSCNQVLAVNNGGGTIAPDLDTRTPPYLLWAQLYKAKCPPICG